MATNILALPEISMPCTIESNMDWIDAITFFDAAGNAVALDGIDFRLQVRVSAELPDVLVDASTDNGLLELLSSGFTITLAGSGTGGYQVGDLIYLAGGTAVASAVMVVTAVKLLALGNPLNVPVDSTQTAGAGRVVGETIVLGPPLNVPMVGAAPSIVIDSVDGSGNATGYHVTNGGNLTVAPVGGLLAPRKAGYAAQTLFFNPVYGITGVVLKDPGIYSALPPSPAAQGSTSGVGAGATFNISQTNNALAIQIPAGALVHPLIEAAGAFQIQAMADGYTQNVASGTMTVTQGIVR